MAAPRAGALAALLASSALAAPQWGQNGGNRYRTGVSPAGWPFSSATETVAQSQPGEQRVVHKLGAPYPLIYTSVSRVREVGRGAAQRGGTRPLLVQLGGGVPPSGVSTRSTRNHLSYPVRGGRGRRPPLRHRQQLARAAT